MSIKSDIEGTLYKWTNYWGGWQPRWVVLHNGILSYYNSSDEVKKGCRASIKISASDIIAYPNDNIRLDIVVPNEQRWYLKASNPAERQAWIIALGTSKATTGKEETKNTNSVSGLSSQELKQNMNEVRLYCDLLVQQACQVKQESIKEKPDPAVLSDSCVLLSTTCDTFLATLKRCLDASESTLIQAPKTPLPLRSISYDGQPALPQLKTVKFKSKKKHSKSTSQSSPTTPTDAKWNPDSVLHPGIQDGSVTNTISDTSSVNSIQSTIAETTLPSKTNIPIVEINTQLSTSSVTAELNHNSSHMGVNASLSDESLLTLFSAMLHSFTDIVLQEDGGIPTLPFLYACEGIIPFLNTIGSTAFAPVRIDFMGNVTKLKTKHSSDPVKFKTLQSILDQEISSCTTRVRNSATDALMWLKRGLRFMQKFLIIFKDGQRDLTVALNQAYGLTLKPYHGWVVKGIFALAVKAVPYYNDFIRALATNPDYANDKRFLGILLKDIEEYTVAMDVVLNLLDNYYESFHLESSAVV